MNSHVYQHTGINRRRFLAISAATAATLVQRPIHTAAPQPVVCAFSKHLQFLDYSELAKTCRELQLDGVDLTVRAGGHVLPANVKTDLPRAVEAIRAEGLEVPMITTRLNHGGDPDARPILETAAQLRIPYFRIGDLKYTGDSDPLAQLEGFAEGLRSLITLAAALGLTAGYHNHSGFDYVGAPLWDLRRLIELVGPEHFGSNFDVGHAVIEGALGVWKTNAALLAPHVKMMAVKDFVWENNKPRWVPLGEGVVPVAEFLKIFRAHGFAGPISLHFEYEVPTHASMLEEVRRAALVLRQALTQAGY